MENNTIPLSQRMNQLIHLGLQPSSQSIDERDKFTADNLPFIPRADGRVINRRTGAVEDAAYPYDATYVEAATAPQIILSKSPDFPFLNRLYGFIGLNVFQDIRGDSLAHAKRVSESIQNVIRDNVKKRGISVGQRQELIRTLSKQQVELGNTRDRLSRIYEAMAPTVKRWWFLASITGYPFDPDTDIDVDFRRMVNEFDPLPYWLLVRYVRLQYEEPERQRLAANDLLYWQAYQPQFTWATQFLSQFQQLILSSSILDADSWASANHIYLFLRDRALSTCFRLVPPISRSTKTAPPKSTAAQAGTVNGPTRKGLGGLAVNDHEWLKPLNKTSIRGRYYSLAYYLSRVRETILNDSVNADQIRLHAISRNEAMLSKGPDAFELVGITRPNAKNILTQQLVMIPPNINPKARPGPRALGTLVSLLGLHASLVPSPTAFTISRILQLDAIRPSLEAWVKQWDELSDALGGLSMEGLSYWTLLFSGVLIPVIRGGTPTEVERFLYDTTPRDLFSTIPGLSWSVNGQPKRASYVSAEAASILDYLFCLRQAVLLPGATNRSDIRNVFSEWHIQPNGDIHCTSSLDRGGERITLHIQQTTPILPNVPASAIPPAALLYERITALVDNLNGSRFALGYQKREKLQEVLSHLTISLILWTKLLQVEAFRDGLLEALVRDLVRPVVLATLQRNLTADPVLDIYRDEVVNVLTELNQYTDLAGHFYHELFRSTFLSPYERNRIDVDVQDQSGDIDPKANFSRASSRNEPVFNITWERLYANVFHWPTHGPYKYWRERILTWMHALPNFNDKKNGPGYSIFTQVWRVLVEQTDWTRPNPVEDTVEEIPTFTQVRLDLDEQQQHQEGEPKPLSQEAVAQQALYQSLAQAMRKKFNPVIVPTRLVQPGLLHEDDITASVPPMDLFHHMIIFVLAYYPRLHQVLLDRQREIDQSLSDANDYIRSIAANDARYVYKEVNDILQNLYVPERDWHMQGLLTGRLEIEPFVTSALGLAYNCLQTLADRCLQGDNLRNVNYKRSYPIFVASGPDYSHLKNIPVDVLTGYTGKNDPLRHYIDPDPKITDPLVLDQLVTSMAKLVQQFIVDVRLDVPEQYKTRMQFEREPMGLMRAQHGMLPFVFTKLGGRAWKVDRL